LFGRHWLPDERIRTGPSPGLVLLIPIATDIKVGGKLTTSDRNAPIEPRAIIIRPIIIIVRSFPMKLYISTKLRVSSLFSSTAATKSEKMPVYHIGNAYLAKV
jgi:hypothetical protein